MLKKIINIENLVHNVNYLKSKSKDSLFCACIKANAYGHGAKIVARAIASKVDYFAVSNILEAIEIAKLQLPPKILILSPVQISEINKCKNYFNKIEFTIDTLKQIRQIEKSFQNAKINVHLKINSGMNRFGETNQYVLQNIIDRVEESKTLNLIGIFTHYFMSENEDELYMQDEKFFSILEKLNFRKKIIVHAANTAAICSKNENVKYNMVRSGIGIYGYGDNQLKPVMSIVGKIEKLMDIKKGEVVGYSKGFIAQKKCKIAIVKIGYADGLSRSLANKFNLLINANSTQIAHSAKIVGNICMDCCFLDVSNLVVNLNDSVTILGRNIDANMYAKKLKTISYEILCMFNNLRCETIII